MAEGKDAYALQRTNSLRVDFPAGQATSVSVASAYQELAVFGDVARIEVPSDSGSMAIVSFYDVRAVDRVFKVLGDRCVVAPEFGNRVVVLRGEEQIQEWMLPEIETVQYDGLYKVYYVTFFDSRVAERVAGEFRSFHVQQPQQQQELWHTVSHDEASSDITAAPRYRNDLRLSQVNWADLASGRDKRTTLQLRCLPAKLCDEMELANILERVRLLHFVNCIRAFPGTGKRLGRALINAGDAEGAAAVAKYFHGRQWGSSLPVSVSFAAVQGLEDIHSTYPPPGPPGLPKPPVRPEPRRVDLVPIPKCNSSNNITGSSSEDPGASEVSTEVGDDAELLAGLTEGPAAVAVVSQPQWASTLAKA